MQQPCPKCENTGKVKVEKPVARGGIMGEVEEDCDLCSGTGWLEEDLMPQLLERFDRIIELLEKISGGK